MVGGTGRQAAGRFVEHKSKLVPALVTPANQRASRVLRTTSSRGSTASPTSFRKIARDRPSLIALTFDDGPYPVFTPMLLDVLRDLRRPGDVLFDRRDAETVAGAHAAHRSRRQRDRRSHLFASRIWIRRSDDQVREEILRGRDVLWDLSRDPAVRTLMRPPHGRYTERTLQVAQSLGYSVVLWTDDSGDWRSVTVDELERHLLEHATAPEIVLLHSGKLATIEALPFVVDRFRRPATASSPSARCSGSFRRATSTTRCERPFRLLRCRARSSTSSRAGLPTSGAACAESSSSWRSC